LAGAGCATGVVAEAGCSLVFSGEQPLNAARKIPPKITLLFNNTLTLYTSCRLRKVTH
jgi:hypothetical protein